MLGLLILSCPKSFGRSSINNLHSADEHEVVFQEKEPGKRPEGEETPKAAPKVRANRCGLVCFGGRITVQVSDCAEGKVCPAQNGNWCEGSSFHGPYRYFFPACINVGERFFARPWEVRDNRPPPPPVVRAPPPAPVFSPFATYNLQDSWTRQPANAIVLTELPNALRDALRLPPNYIPPTGPGVKVELEKVILSEQGKDRVFVEVVISGVTYNVNPPISRADLEKGQTIRISYSRQEDIGNGLSVSGGGSANLRFDPNTGNISVTDLTGSAVIQLGFLSYTVHINRPGAHRNVNNLIGIRAP